MKPATRSIVAGAAVFAVMSFVAIQTPAQQKLADRASRAAADEPATPAAVPAGGGTPGPPGTATPVVRPSAAPAPSGGDGGEPDRSLACAPGRNGGATDKGVSATKIHLASTEVLSGSGSSFLGASHVGMEAVIATVNAHGGVCGRLLDLDLRDDGWDPGLGAAFIQNWINDPHYFALPVVPSSEGLTQAIRSRVVSSGQMPVIGTDGMLAEQYQDPWVWPVATATASSMRIMAKYAYDVLGARSFGIVYDNRYRFGKEGGQAFRDYVAKLPGASVPAVVGVQPGQPSYPETETFNSACGPTRRCDFVAMLLEPDTALTWIDSMGDDSSGRRYGFGSKGTGGAQTLFSAKFARDCGEPCGGMLLWTGYNPPIGERLSLPGVAQYVADVRAIDPGADPTNQFLEGAYLGMSVFVQALRDVGPRLTRPALRDAMDRLRYASDLSAPLAWSAGNHDANLGAQAFVVRTAAGSFAGFADAGTGFLADPTPGVFPRVS